ncbi:3-keto-5-aminohexanoate cleavage protein [Salinivibrio costicola]|uniref:3-keto-5-aminohexanoate cleavage protein n=1 Tax=Salinivibrio costicola TaxID=51367 RepID=UPI003F6F2657
MTRYSRHTVASLIKRQEAEHESQRHSYLRRYRCGRYHGQKTNVPITPKQIADNCIEAARAGASVAHIHVRDPETGGISHNIDHFREVMERVRESDVDIVMNITGGGGEGQAGWKSFLNGIISSANGVQKLTRLY